ncbi:MAG: hypothetical protein IPK68_22755 [Bdellovibrionales bacterium]|nr:hypothetical protein [Bdellovibrionales bacterium]
MKNKDLSLFSLEQDRGDLEAASTLYKTPPMPDLGAALKQNIFTADVIPIANQVRKIRRYSKQLKQEIESIYGG